MKERFVDIKEEEKQTMQYPKDKKQTRTYPPNKGFKIIRKILIPSGFWTEDIDLICVK
jgi:hypothetical protein